MGMMVHLIGIFPPKCETWPAIRLASPFESQAHPSAQRARFVRLHLSSPPR
jgi:hypothetical protein